VSDQKDRLGQTLHDRAAVIENHWASQHEEEILAKLREKYAKHVNCLVCGKQLTERAAVGLGGMVCPDRHGAWLEWGTLEALRARLASAAAAHHEGFGEKIFEAVDDIVRGLLKHHPKEIHCPDCGTALEARAAVAYGSIGLGGMACPKNHGAWLDWPTLQKVRDRLASMENAPAS
jgi:Zn-finger nucleic acid-binding protein